MLEPAADATPAVWVVERVRNFDYTVGSIVPPGYEAYARVFHPAWLTEHETERPVRWSAVAAARGTTMHPIAEWEQVASRWRTPDDRSLWDRAPETGALDPASLAALAAVLGGYTTTAPVCWFGVWEGYGGVLGRLVLFKEGTPAEEQQRITAELEEKSKREEARRASAPTFTLPDRPMRLLAAPLDAMSEEDPLAEFGLSGHSPNIWWPEDRAWCVGSEIDLMTTYVGASAACIEAICAAPGLEALPASVDQLVTSDSDTVNPPSWS